MATTLTFNSALGALVQEISQSTSVPANSVQRTQALGIAKGLSDRIRSFGVLMAPTALDGGAASSVADAFYGIQAAWEIYSWASVTQQEMVRGEIEKAKAQIVSLGVS